MMPALGENVMICYQKPLPWRMKMWRVSMAGIDQSKMMILSREVPSRLSYRAE